MLLGLFWNWPIDPLTALRYAFAFIKPGKPPLLLHCALITLQHKLCLSMQEKQEVSWAKLGKSCLVFQALHSQPCTRASVSPKLVLIAGTKRTRLWGTSGIMALIWPREVRSSPPLEAEHSIPSPGSKEWKVKVFSLTAPCTLSCLFQRVGLVFMPVKSHHEMGTHLPSFPYTWNNADGASSYQAQDVTNWSHFSPQAVHSDVS